MQWSMMQAQSPFCGRWTPYQRTWGKCLQQCSLPLKPPYHHPSRRTNQTWALSSWCWICLPWSINRGAHLFQSWKGVCPSGHGRSHPDLIKGFIWFEKLWSMLAYPFLQDSMFWRFQPKLGWSWCVDETEPRIKTLGIHMCLRWWPMLGHERP